jgi:hypothetical protein
MKTPITPEAMIEEGFVQSNIWFTFGKIRVDIKLGRVWFDEFVTSATTIDEIKDLIRLFK